jgi:hypothetical protein
MTVLLVIALVFTLADSSPLSARPRKRYCTVNLVGGGLVKGYFVAANSSRLIVEVDGARQTIMLDRVANILFIVDFKNQRMEDVKP